jgi:hypothetical protein
MPSSNLYERVLAFQEALVGYATGRPGLNEDQYMTGRRELVSARAVQRQLPGFVTDCRTLAAFWAWIKGEADNYAQRRRLIRDAFRPLLEAVEEQHSDPLNDVATGSLRNLDGGRVLEIWRKATERRDADPEGAITAARTLLETVCKLILDQEEVAYGKNESLPKLYGITAGNLNLAPKQHGEEAFKAILGGCHTVVNGLATLRNELGDAHGKGRKAARPASRHAGLAVNLAGSMAVFLVETWRSQVPF